MSKYYQCKFYNIRFEACEIMNRNQCPIIKYNIPWINSSSNMYCIKGRIKLDWIKELIVKDIIGVLIYEA